MKDIIWTLIVVWFIYKIIDVFQGRSKTNLKQQQKTTVESPKDHEKNLRTVIQKHVNNEGEYVDFEEVK